MKRTVFVPVTPEQLRGLAEGAAPTAGLIPDHAFAATAELTSEFGYGPDEDEEADYAAQSLAGVQALLQGQPRVVLAAECEATPAEPAGHGTVHVDALSWQRVKAIFVDEPEAVEAARSLATELAGQSIETAWEQDLVRQFVAEHELLWFATQEFAAALELAEG